jgi:anti-sigma B factor antagonist
MVKAHPLSPSGRPQAVGGSVTDMQIRARGVAEGPIVLALTGEIDIANAAEVRAQLDVLVGSTTGDVRIDCSGLEFIDSSGLDVLVGTRRELEQRRRRLILARPTAWLRGLLVITALDQVFDVESADRMEQ